MRRFEAFYHLAKIQAAQIKIAPASLKLGACSIMALPRLFLVSERGSWGEDLIQEREMKLGRRYSEREAAGHVEMVDCR